MNLQATESRMPSLYRMLFLGIFLLSEISMAGVLFIYVATQNLSAWWFLIDFFLFTFVIGLILVSSYLVVRRAVGKSLESRKKLVESDKSIKAQRDLALELAGTDSLEQASKAALRMILEISGFDSGGVYIHEEDSDSLELVYHEGLSPGFAESACRYVKGDTSYDLVMEGRSVYSDYGAIGVNKDEARISEGLKAVAIIPVIHRGHVIGCVNIASHTEDALPNGLKYVVEAMADQIGQAISRSKLASALQLNEQRYRLLAENASDVIWTLDLDLNMTYVSPSIERQSGFTPEEMVSMDLDEIIAPASLERGMAIFQESMEAEDSGELDPDKIWRLDVEHYCKDGSTSWVELSMSAIRDLNGDAVGILGVARDITEKKVAAEALRESEERYRLIADTSLAGIFLHDGNNLLYMNDRATEISGYPREYFKSMKEILDLLPPDEQERILSNIRRRIAGEDVAQVYDTKIIRADGTTADVLLMNNLITLDGKPAIMVTFHDITERKHAEIELQRINAELEIFAHTVSHDLKSPLSSVKFANQTLQELISDLQIEEVQSSIEEVMEVIDTGIRKSTALIDDLLTLAEAGQVPTEISEIKVRDVVDRILEERSGDIDERGVQVEVEPDLGSIAANATQIYQLFSNLIGNSILHNDRESPKLWISHEDFAGGSHRYLIKDNGSGIPPNVISRIFIPFVKEASGGSGIGLATVDKIVKLYKGHIRAYNDGGACFEFVLKDMPFAEKPASVGAPQTESTAAPSDKIHQAAQGQSDDG